MKLLFTIIFSIISSTAFTQEKMIVDQPYNGLTVYGEFSENVNSISNLPFNIQSNISAYLALVLGSLKENVSYSHGQTIDLEKYFSENKDVFKYEWIVPKYDLNFILQDSSIGIVKYYLHLRLDQFGQILYCNWPRNSYSNKNEFKSRREIEKVALNEASKNNISDLNYKVELNYIPKLDILCWIFSFPSGTPKLSKSTFEVFRINWRNLDLLDHYHTARITYE